MAPEPEMETPPVGTGGAKTGYTGPAYTPSIPRNVPACKIHVTPEQIRDAAQADPVRAYERAGLTGIKREGNDRWQAVCPLHADANPSLKVFADGGFKCFGCAASGSILDFYMALRHVDFARACEDLGDLLGLAGTPNTWKPNRPPTASPKPARPPDPDPPLIPDGTVQTLHKALLSDPVRLAWLTERKGIPLWVVEVAAIGLGVGPCWAGNARYAIPVPTLDGSGWCDVRGYRPNAKPKMLPWQKGSGRPALYPWPWVCAEPALVWTEGEWDALNLIGRGIPALTCTCGVDGALSVDLPNLRGKTFTVLGDADAAGDRLAKELPARLYAAGAAAVSVASWEELTGYARA